MIFFIGVCPCMGSFLPPTLCMIFVDAVEKVGFSINPKTSRNNLWTSILIFILEFLNSFHMKARVYLQGSGDMLFSENKSPETRLNFLSNLRLILFNFYDHSVSFLHKNIHATKTRWNIAHSTPRLRGPWPRLVTTGIINVKKKPSERGRIPLTQVQIQNLFLITVGNERSLCQPREHLRQNFFRPTVHRWNFFLDSGHKAKQWII